MNLIPYDGYCEYPLFLDCCSKDELEFYAEFNNARLWRIDYSFNLQVPEALVPLYLHQFNGSVIEKNRLKRIVDNHVSADRNT